MTDYYLVYGLLLALAPLLCNYLWGWYKARKEDKKVFDGTDAKTPAHICNKNCRPPPDYKLPE